MSEPTTEDFEATIKPIWLKTKPGRIAQTIRSSLSVEFDAPQFKQWMSDFCPDYVWDLIDIAAQRGIETGYAAAIKALREPSEIVVRAVCNCQTKSAHCSYPECRHKFGCRSNAEALGIAARLTAADQLEREAAVRKVKLEGKPPSTINGESE